MRTLIRLVFVLILVAVVGLLLMGYWPAGLSLQKAGTESPSSGRRHVREDRYGTRPRTRRRHRREGGDRHAENSGGCHRGGADDQDQGEDGPRRYPQGAGHRCVHDRVDRDGQRRGALGRRSRSSAGAGARNGRRVGGDRSPEGDHAVAPLESIVPCYAAAP